MLVLANLPALLLVLNLAGDEPPRGSSMEPAQREFTEVGFARVHMNRDIRFVAADTQARDTLERLETAGPPPSARGLPNRLESRRSSVHQMDICDLLRCPRR